MLTQSFDLDPRLCSRTDRTRLVAAPGVIPTSRHSPSCPLSLRLLKQSHHHVQHSSTGLQYRRAGLRAGPVARGAHLLVDEGVLLLVALPSQPLTDHTSVFFLGSLQLTGRKSVFLILVLHLQGAEEIISPVSKDETLPA